MDRFNKRHEHFTINLYAPDKNQGREASRIDINIHKEENLYVTIHSKKDMSIKLQVVGSPRIQP